MNLSMEVTKNDGPESGSTSMRSDISDLASHVMNPLCLPAQAKHQQDTNVPHGGGNSDCCTGNTSSLMAPVHQSKPCKGKDSHVIQQEDVGSSPGGWMREMMDTIWLTQSLLPKSSKRKCNEYWEFKSAFQRHIGFSSLPVTIKLDTLIESLLWTSA
ncbi:hypothetical protein E2C01_049545 [Portunus trituberculatus]|uniref:Uncharacterized protein n=1 Tax=Portunus trituberculatus TaxID=210409 RepID=A0A5B7GE75_PORTR|nr:hypothetical protein [Portunus trituberculatus]